MNKNIGILGAAAVLAEIVVGVNTTNVHADDNGSIKTTEVSPSTDILKEGTFGSGEGATGATFKVTKEGGENVLYIGPGTAMNILSEEDLGDFAHQINKVVFEKPVSGVKFTPKMMYFGSATDSASGKNFWENIGKDLTVSGLKNIDVSNVSTFYALFNEANTYDQIADVNGWDISGATRLEYMFYDSTAKGDIDLSSWNNAKFTSTDSMFYDAKNLSSIKVFQDFRNITVTERMFSGTNIKTLDMSNRDFISIDPNSYGMQEMFSNMPNLTSIDVSGWTLSNNGIDMTSMFLGDRNLKYLDLSSWENSKDTVDGYLMGTGIKRISISKDTALNNSFLGAKTIIDGDGNVIPVDNDNNPVNSIDSVVYDGYWVRIDGQDDPSKPNEPISAKKFVNDPNGTYSGTYQWIANKDDNTTMSLDATIESNKGQQTSTVKGIKYSDVAAGKEISVSVPDFEGLTPDKSTVQAKVVIASDGSYQLKVIDPDKAGYVTYSDKNSGNNNGSSSNNSNSGSGSHSDETDVNRLVETYPDRNDVTLYKKDGDKITSRALAKGTGWRSDREMTRAGVKYYRVATNEWVKASDVYVYENQKLVVKTPKDSDQRLTNSHGDLVTNRALARATAWKVDRLAYINNTTYYRVATNEFVPTNEVTVE